MVRVAVAGGAGDVGQEIIAALVATKKHEILLLSRKDVPPGVATTGVKWAKTNYEDPKQLADILQGFNTLLSFITPQSDPGNLAQRNLIDAAVQAGVRRFAPSEWASSSFDHMEWYDGKAKIREYLAELNKNGIVLEYTLFQPGMFVNYFTYPYKSAQHVHPLETHIDFYNRRAIMLEGSDDDRITLTTAQDLANVVVRAIEYEGTWPLIGGVKGDEVSIGQLVALGERIRGGAFHIDWLRANEVKNGVLRSSWLPKVSHPAIPAEQADQLAGNFVGGMLLGMSAGALNVSDEWNQLLPDYKFTGAEEFLTEAWHSKP